jgi:hypothetical protein
LQPVVGLMSVNVIRHQNKRVNVITASIELQQTTFDFRAHIRPPHVASPHASTEPFLQAADKVLFIFALFLNSPWLRM